MAKDYQSFACVFVGEGALEQLVCQMSVDESSLTWQREIANTILYFWRKSLLFLLYKSALFFNEIVFPVVEDAVELPQPFFPRAIRIE